MSPTSEEKAANSPEETELKRGLSARHLQMIAIGGAIGTGLFVASGKTISTAGPGGAIVAYGLIGIMVLFLMQSLGEMAAHLPSRVRFKPMQPVTFHHPLGSPWGGITGLTGRLPSRPSSWRSVK